MVCTLGNAREGSTAKARTAPRTATPAQRADGPPPRRPPDPRPPGIQPVESHRPKKTRVRAAWRHRRATRTWPRRDGTRRPPGRAASAGSISSATRTGRPAIRTSARSTRLGRVSLLAGRPPRVAFRQTRLRLPDSRQAACVSQPEASGRRRRRSSRPGPSNRLDSRFAGGHPLARAVNTDAPRRVLRYASCQGLQGRPTVWGGGPRVGQSDGLRGGKVRCHSPILISKRWLAVSTVSKARSGESAG